MAEHDLVVIGAGPGGYVAALRAAQLGMNVACIDKSSRLGGTCLRIGCIPSKALLESSELFADAQHSFADHGVKLKDVALDLKAMLKRKDRVVDALTKGVASLFKKHGVQAYEGTGRIDGPGRVVVDSDGGETQELRAKHILIATGSKPAALKGVDFDGDLVGTSTDALAYSHVPKHLVVIGAGYIGLELGAVWSRLGAEVTVLEYFDRILPGTDADIAQEAQKVLSKQGLEFRLGSRVTGIRTKKKDGCVVECEGGDEIACDRILVAVGRTPNTDNLGLDAVGIETDEKGRIRVNENYETTVEGVFAIGDVIAGPMLAHKASEEGVACVERLATGYGHVNYDAIPSVVYTHPEIAAVGRTEDQLREDGIEYRVGTFPFRGNGRARALGQMEGFIKILADSRTDRLLGVHIIGPRAGDLIAEAAVAMEFAATSEDLARCTHAHPTLSEAIKEAALAVDDRALHV